MNKISATLLTLVFVGIIGFAAYNQDSSMLINKHYNKKAPASKSDFIAADETLFTKPVP